VTWATLIREAIDKLKRSVAWAGIPIFFTDLSRLGGIAFQGPLQRSWRALLSARMATLLGGRNEATYESFDIAIMLYNEILVSKPQSREEMNFDVVR